MDVFCCGESSLFHFRVGLLHACFVNGDDDKGTITRKHRKSLADRKLHTLAYLVPTNDRQRDYCWVYEFFETMESTIIIFASVPSRFVHLNHLIISALFLSCLARDFDHTILCDSLQSARD